MAEKVLTTASGRQVKAGTPGAIGYESSALLPSGQGTVDGDVFNQFRGYVGPQGGTFGGGPSADPVAARRAWESVSGVSGDKLGDTSGWDAAKWDEARRTFGGIANRDKDTTLQALQSDNPFVRETAQRYAQENGWVESPVATPAKVQNVPVPPSDTAPEPIPDSALDLYGQRDAATSRRPVMKVSDTFETLRQQARRMATPQLLPQSGTVPNTGTLPANPFDQFSAAQAPAAQSQAMTPAVGTGFETTLESGVLSPRIGTSPSDVEQGVPLPGGVQTTPTGDEEAVFKPRIVESPVQMMGAPASGGMGSAASAAGNVASGGGFGASPSGDLGGVPGLRKLGKQRNPLTPDSRQGSGLFSGLRKLGQAKRGVPSPTGGSPMAPNLSAY